MAVLLKSQILYLTRFPRFFFAKITDPLGEMGCASACFLLRIRAFEDATGKALGSVLAERKDGLLQSPVGVRGLVVAQKYSVSNLT